MIRFVVALAALIATACTQVTPGAATPESYPLPPDFPNLAGYTVIGEEAPFWHAEGKWIGWSFTGPGDIDCTVELFGAYDDGRATCVGALPGRAPGTWEVQVTQSSPGALAYRYPEPYRPDRVAPALPPRHLVRDAESGLVCGRPDELTLACQIRGHGFVVVPTGTSVF